MKDFNFTVHQKVWLIFALAALFLFLRLGSAPIYILDEAKNAQCAREMWYNGDPIVPTFNGQLRTDKPPLHYWFMGVAYHIAGVGAAQARFFSGVMGLFTLFITFQVVRKFAGVQIGFYSILALLLSPHFLFEFRLSVPDPYLIAFTTAGLFFGFEYIEKQKKWPLLMVGLFLGLAVLAKGPVALVLPCFIFLLYMVITRQWHPIKNPLVIVAILLALGIAFPWYWMVHQKTAGAFTRGFFIEHNLERFSSEKEGHGGPFIITPLIVMIGLLPLSLFTIHSLKKINGFWSNRLYLFSTLVIGVYIVFFSISSTKLPNYPMPCYPFAAVMAGFALHKIISNGLKVPDYIRWIWLILSLCIPIAAFFGLRAEDAVRQFAWIAALLLILPIGNLWVFISGKQKGSTFLSILAIHWMIFSAVFLWVGYPIIYRENPVAKLLPIAEGAEKMIAYKTYNPAFNFNLQRPKDKILVFENLDSLNLWFEINPKAIEEGIPLVSRKEYSADLRRAGFEQIAESRDLFELPTTVIFKKRKALN